MTKSTTEAALCSQADTVTADLAAQDASWGRSGWTRRRFIGGVGMVGAGALASQLVTSRVAFATTPDASTTNTLVVIFLRGAADGLRILSPHSSDLGLTYLQQVRPDLVPDAPIALDGTAGWALNANLTSLHDTLWASGELAFVPGVSTAGISRSHFQAQQYVEKGGSDTATDGWLNRALANLGSGTTFRAVSLGGPTPLAMLGAQRTLAMPSLQGFDLSDWNETESLAAISKLYRGMTGSLAQDVPTTLSALATAAPLRAQAKSYVAQNDAAYPDGDFSRALQNLAVMLRGEAGLQVATIDVGGWDTHTDEASDLDRHLDSFGRSLSAFMTDLGPDRRKRVTVVVQTEFGRRVAMNDSGGTDHGHGSLMWLLGGGLQSSGVFGTWTALGKDSLDDGDVPGVNNPFDVLGEVLSKRLGAGLTGVFPKHTYAPLGVAASA